MINKGIWLGILIMVLVFGMAVIGCNNDSTDSTTKFEGTWTRTGDSLTLVFSNNNVNIGNGVYVGTFTFDNDEITFTRDGNNIIFEYTLSGTTLVLTASLKNTGGGIEGANQIQGTFSK